MADEEPYDSTKDTQDHIEKVRLYLGHVIDALKGRGIYHDLSKLIEPEKSIFDRFTPLLRVLPYGRDDYKACLLEMWVGLEHHYAHNSHHPEHWPISETPASVHLKAIMENMDQSHPAIPYLKTYLGELESRINGMSLLDATEMLTDWKAATLRHADGDLGKSLEVNRVRFKMSDQLYQIFKNTIDEMGW